MTNLLAHDIVLVLLVEDFKFLRLGVRCLQLVKRRFLKTILIQPSGKTCRVDEKPVPVPGEVCDI